MNNFGGMCPAHLQGRCAELLALSPRADAGFTIRVIDECIHAPIVNTPENYRAKQMRVLDLVHGCERAIFNDPRVVYPPWRPHFSGVTGTLSNNLTGTFYHLYHHMMNFPGIVINAKADLVTMFYAAYSMDFERIPFDDLLVIHDIVQNLLDRTRREGWDVFQPDWWEALPARLEDIIRQMNERPAYAHLENVFPLLLGEEYSVYTYGPYEDFVNYLHFSTHTYQTKLIRSIHDLDMHQLQLVHALFAGNIFSYVHAGGRRGGRSRRSRLAKRTKRTRRAQLRSRK